MHAPGSRVLFIAAAFLAGVTACASIIGLGDYEVSDPAEAGADAIAAGDATPARDAPAADTSPEPVVEAGSDAPLPACACLSAIPTGWTSVAFMEGQTSDCPADLTTVDLVSSPSISGGAPCSCATCKVNTPSCTANTWRALYNDNAVPNCSQTGVVHQVNGGACVTGDGSLAGKFARVEPPSPAGTPTCTSDGVFDPGGVATKPLRSCTATPGGTSCPCDVALGSFAACIQAAGDLSCPDAFPKKHLGGSGVSGSCGACTCTPANVKCTATASYFSDEACANLLDTIDGDCKATTMGGMGTTYRSLKWAGDASATCTLKPPASTETLSLKGPTTICCP